MITSLDIVDRTQSSLYSAGHDKQTA